jgi:hypothetical protein
MRVRVLTKAAEETGMDGPPTAETLQAFAAMDIVAEALVKAGVFVAAAGFKGSSETRRIVVDGKRRAGGAKWKPGHYTRRLTSPIS